MIDFESYQQELLKRSEQEFSLILEKFPHSVCTKFLLDVNITDDYRFSNHVCEISDTVRNILSENFCEGDYVMFPEAMGMYTKYSNSVLFKKADDAVLFKLMLS